MIDIIIYVSPLFAVILPLLVKYYVALKQAGIMNIDSRSIIDSYNKWSDITIDLKKISIKEKQKCINCGATKIKNKECDYCGT